MTRGELIAISWILFVIIVSYAMWVLLINPSPQPTLSVQHPTLETVADATPGNVIKFVVLELGTHVPKDSVYYTANLGHFTITDVPGEIVLVPPIRTLWHPDSCSVRLEVVK